MSMKAAVVEKAGTMTLKTIPIPEPKHGEILVKIHTCGVCHTDVHIRDGELDPKLPVVAGHEGAGVVAKVGPGVTNLKVGDRVGVAWLHDACGLCENCLSGWENVCEKQKQQTGRQADGCFAEYTLANELFVVRIPDGLSFADTSPILCAGVTAYKGLKETEARAGQWVAIVGASGGLGHVAMQYANIMGFKVVAVEFGKEKVDYCIAHGAMAGVDASKEDAVKAVKKITDGGAHGVLVLAPSVKAYEDAAKYVRSRGVMVGIGLPSGQFKVDIFDWISTRKTLRGSFVGSRLDLKEALDIAATGAIKCQIQEKPFDQVNKVLDDLKKGVINGRVVLKISSP